MPIFIERPCGLVFVAWPGGWVQVLTAQAAASLEGQITMALVAAGVRELAA